MQLATHFEVSRGPVREALRMLQREGLIEAETNQRGRVATFSPREMEEVCALLVVNVAVAITVGDGLFTEQDVERIHSRIDLIERLADDNAIATDWCEGFMDAFALRGDNWDELMRTEQGRDWMFPILAHLFGEDGKSLVGATEEQMDALLGNAKDLDKKLSEYKVLLI